MYPFNKREKERKGGRENKGKKEEGVRGRQRGEEGRRKITESGRQSIGSVFNKATYRKKHSGNILRYVSPNSSNVIKVDLFLLPLMVSCIKK